MKKHTVQAANSPKLTPQAQQIAGIVSRVGPLTHEALIKRMCKQVKAKKPLSYERASRLLSYYKRPLIESGLLVLQFAAPKSH